MNSPKEPTSPKSMISKAWNSAHSPSKKNMWNFRKLRERSALPAMPEKIKRVGKDDSGKDVYTFGQYRGCLADVKEFAAFKGLASLKMGAVTIRTIAA